MTAAPKSIAIAWRETLRATAGSWRGSTIASALAANNYRGPGFDALRLFAASLVVVHHAMAVQYDIEHDALSAYSGGYTQLGLFAVSMFFSLSGFLVTPGLLKSGNVTAYLSRRFMRIMPLLTVVVVATVFLIGPFLTSLTVAEYFRHPMTWLYLKNITTSLSLSLPGVVSYVGGEDINGPLWTLRYEWICYLSLAGLALLKIIRQRFFLLLLYFTMLVFSAFWELSGPLEITWYLGSFFGSGVIFYLYSDKVAVSYPLTIMAFAVLAIALPTGAGPFLAPLLVSYIIVSFGVLGIPLKFTYGSADLSYGVYLMHSLVLTRVSSLHKFDKWWELFTVGYALTVMLAFVTWRLVEEPCLRHKTLPARCFNSLFAKFRQAPVHGRDY